MSIWLLISYAIAMFAAVLVCSARGAPTTLSYIVPAVALAIFVAGLLLRGIRPPVV